MKKLLSILLAMCMIFTMFTFSAAAAETGYYLHIGDTSTFYAGTAGSKITFPMSVTAVNDKHFVGWCTDAACTNLVTADPTISSGTPVHYYALLKDYTTYHKDEFETVTKNDTVKQYAHFVGDDTTYHGYTMPLYGTKAVSGTGVFTSSATSWSPGYLFMKDSDGTYVNAAPNTKYHMTIKYRVPTLSNSGKLVIYPVYGLHARFAGMANVNNMELHSKTGSALATITAASTSWVTKEVDFTTGLLASGDVDTYIPNIGFRIYHSAGTVKLEVDYVEVQTYKTVDCNYIDASSESISDLLYGDTINYPTLSEGSKWSLSRTEYIAVPETVGEDSITVYEYNGTEQEVTTHTVTFVDANGNETVEEYDVGTKITYPTLSPASFNKTDNVWSLSRTYYDAPPLAMGNEDITVYKYSNPVMSFENYNHSYTSAVTNEWLDNAMISSEKAYSGNYSMKYHNYNLKALTSAPSDWSTNWKAYYKYTKSTDKFSKLTTTTAPTFVAGSYYKERASYELNQGTFFTPIYLGTTANGPYTYNYRITLKYYVPSGSTSGIKITAYHINTDSIFLTGTKSVSDTYSIPATATNGWQTLTMEVSASNFVVNNNGAYTKGNQAIVLKVNTTANTTANARTATVYFDDIKCENLARNRVTLIDGKFETTLFGERGATIEYPELTGEAKWSLSPDSYVAVPTTFEGEITVYAYGQQLDTFLYGDCDGDGKMVAGDLAQLKLHLVGMGDVEVGADCDDDGLVDVTDLAYLKLWLAGALDPKGEGSVEGEGQRETVFTNMGIPTEYITSKKARSIWDLRIWDGKMYIGNGNYSASVGPLPVMAYNFATSEWEDTGEVFGEEISRFIEINGELTIPDIDPRDYNNKGNYYILRNGTWVKFRNVPSGEHVYDMIAYDGKVFAGVGTNEKLCPTSPISVSTDNGVTFTLIDCYKNGTAIDFAEEWYYTRCHELFTIKDDLYALIFFYTTTARTPELYKYNKSKGYFEYYKYSPEYVIVETPKLGNEYVTSTEEFGDEFFYTTDYLYAGTDIDSLYKVELPNNEYVRKFIVRDGKMYILAYTINEVNGVTTYTTRVYESSDGKNSFKKLFELEFGTSAVSIEKNGNDFYIGFGNISANNALNGTLMKVSI